MPLTYNSDINCLSPIQDDYLYQVRRWKLKWYSLYDTYTI